jgi:hypothetical protein
VLNSDISSRPSSGIKSVVERVEEGEDPLVDLGDGQLLELQDNMMAGKLGS